MSVKLHSRYARGQVWHVVKEECETALKEFGFEGWEVTFRPATRSEAVSLFEDDPDPEDYNDTLNLYNLDHRKLVVALTKDAEPEPDDLEGVKEFVQTSVIQSLLMVLDEDEVSDLDCESVSA